MRGRIAAAALLGAMVVGGLTLGLRAQTNQPIYPVYDGFLKNPDGSYTLSFAYFSHNADIIAIPPGAANAFGPAPGDRMQPTVFKPGHWRFQCVMVVGPDFDGKLKWTLSYAGTTTGTSERMLQSNWNLVEGAAQLEKIDYAKVPKGVCLNRPPTVRILGLTPRRGEVPVLTTGVNEELNLFGSAHDEGLPRGRALASEWRVLNGPGKVAFAPPASARTKATFAISGLYELELTASDGEFTERVRLNVKVP
ncbi:MAG TPA: hypothetical protein VM820_06660 [Vicinamibacterales bacterium]|nr:hypothetical protein [Vicinamibacterales bacterium]